MNNEPNQSAESTNPTDYCGEAFKANQKLLAEALVVLAPANLAMFSGERIDAMFAELAKIDQQLVIAFQEVVFWTNKKIQCLEKMKG